ncbi:hypothetical protein ACLK1T_23700 [Escherichia coli]
MKFFSLFIYRPVATVYCRLPLPCGILGFRTAAGRPAAAGRFPVIMVSASLPVRHQKRWRLPLPRRWSARWAHCRSA